MSLRFVRDLLGLVLPFLWTMAAVLPFWWFWDRLPDPMASHWRFSGQPDDALPRLACLILLGGITGTAAIGAGVISRRAPAGRGEIVPGLATASFVGVLMALLAVTTVTLNVDAPHWQAAGALPWAWILAIAAAAIGAAVSVRHGSATLEVGADFHAAAPKPSIGLRPGERAVWTGTSSNRYMVGGAVVLAAITLGGLVVMRWPSMLATGAVAIAIAVFSRASVRIDGSGLLIRLGGLDVPRIRVPLRRIQAARATHVAPLVHGGWGYRGSLNALGRAAVVIRSGEGLELDLEGDKRFIVTVDDAHTAAGLVNDLVRQQQASP